MSNIISFRYTNILDLDHWHLRYLFLPFNWTCIGIYFPLKTSSECCVIIQINKQKMNKLMK